MLVLWSVEAADLSLVIDSAVVCFVAQNQSSELHLEQTQVREKKTFRKWRIITSWLPDFCSNFHISCGFQHAIRFINTCQMLLNKVYVGIFNAWCSITMCT